MSTLQVVETDPSLSELEALGWVPTEKGEVQVRSRAKISDTDRKFVASVLDKIDLGAHNRDLIFLIALRMLNEVRAQAGRDKAEQDRLLTDEIERLKGKLSTLNRELEYYRARDKFNPTEISYIVTHLEQGVRAEVLAELLGGTVDDIEQAARSAQHIHNYKGRGTIRFKADRSGSTEKPRVVRRMLDAS